MATTVQSANSENEDIKLVIGNREKHFDIIYQMFIQQYFHNDPITKALGVTLKEVSNIYRDILEHTLESSYSVLAFIGDKCVGWSLNYVIPNVQKTDENPNTTFNNEFAQEIHNKSSAIEVVFDEIERNYGYFVPECNKLFKLDVLFVDREYHGKEIETKLVQKTIEIAKENKCDYLMSVANTKEAFHILYTLGFKCVREIHYTSFLDCGQRIFKRRLSDESETINLMFLKLNSSMPDPKMQS